MSLTAADVGTTSSTAIPSVIGTAVAIDTGNGKGVALSNSGGKPRLVSIVGDAAWAWHQNDSVAIANMRAVASGVPYRVQVPPGQTINLYMKTASTANVVVALEF